MNALETRTVASGAVELAVAEAGDSSRPTIVFAHGYPDTKELWEPVLALLRSRFHVVAYDLRGAGGSSAPRGPAAYALSRLADDLEAVAKAVAPEQRVHLVGHDWGGVAGWEFATSPRFEGTLASFTSVAGPSLDQASGSLRSALRRGRVLDAVHRVWRSWYIWPLLTPGAPTVAWMLLGPRWWTWFLQNVERIAVDDAFPAPTLRANGRHGANLYRANIAGRILRPGRAAVAHVPVQLVVPSGDHFISEAYYERAERDAPRLRRRIVEGSHWAPRNRPALIAKWVGEFVEEVEAGGGDFSAGPWVRGGGLEQLRGRLALVTGAGSGIGRACALALAEHGARLLLVDRDHGSASETAESIAGAHVFTCDVADGEAMERLANAVIGEHGVPDVLVNNAGIGVAGRFIDTEFSQWRRVLDVNLMGVVHGCQLFGRAMVEHGHGGQIVNIASAAAFGPTRDLPAYASSKAAVLMLSECLRAELAPAGIGVTAACPGLIATNITRNTVYVGRGEQDQQRLRDYVTRAYRRRNFTPEQVAAEIVEAIAADRPVAVITPEAKAIHLLSRVAPSVLRRVAKIEALPV